MCSTSIGIVRNGLFFCITPFDVFAQRRLKLRNALAGGVELRL